MPGFAERAPGLVRVLVIPLLVLTVTQVAIRSVARYCGEDPGRNRTWVHWDSYRYIDVARRGYVEVPEDPLASNTGWFPGYPLLMRLVAAATSTRPALAGRVVSGVFLLGLLSVLVGGLIPSMSGPQRLLALVIAGVFPGWMYCHAVFPQSMFIFFSLTAIALGARGHHLPAGLSGALAAFTYPTGVLVAAPLAVLISLAPGRTARQRLTGLAQGPGVAVLGLAAVAAAQRVEVGHWDAYLRLQKELGAGLHNPLEVLAGHVRPLLSLRASAETLIAFEAAGTSLLLLGAALLYWRRREQMRPVDTALLAYAAVMWVLVNAAGPGMSLTRQAAAMVCVVPLLARLRPAVQVGVLVVLVPLAIGMAVLFFRDVLV